MLIDGKQLERDAVLRAEICIVGTGMGALSVASALIAERRSVLFIETGPLEQTRRAHAALQIENVGRPFGISTSRGLEVGGGTAFWHGVCAPLDEEDFQARPWMAHSGWPIGRSELDPWYATAEEFLCGRLDRMACNTDQGARLAGHLDRRKMDRQTTDRRTTDVLDAKTYCYRSSPFRGKDLLREWCTHGKARCVYNSTALRLLHQHGKAHTLVVGSAGHQFSVIANKFVIAAGALETPRLLLNSLLDSLQGTPARAASPPASWWLGRNLIDHPVGYLSQIRFHLPSTDDGAAPDRRDPVLRVFPGFVLTPGIQHQHQLPNHTMFVRQGISSRPVPNRAVMSFLGVRGTRDIRLTHLTSLTRHPYILWRIAHQKLSLRPRSRYGDLFFMTEQLPNPDSRVSLSERQRDRFGLPIARVDWRLSEQDISMFAEYHQLLMANLREHEEVRGLRADSMARWEDSLASGAHHLGTARMAANARDGVVDADLKIFGFENAWISDGSVFPTGGSVNPSLTICALGHRLGHHLNRLSP
jgi:choline dehydrogenase-like flavoprotein